MRRLILLCLLHSTEAFNFETFSIDETFTIFIPTLNSSNEKCRNHSLFYLEEMKKMKLWATEMFDASSKLPSGVLIGSAFNFGNFDECVRVKVPLEGENLVGKYCMAKFDVIPPQSKRGPNLHRFYDVDDPLINETTWDKVIAFSNDRSVKSRNDFYLSFCIPSSCRHVDLESSLQEFSSKINSSKDFKVTISVDPRKCQTKEELVLNTADITFISVILTFLLLVILATVYDCFLKSDDLKRYGLGGKTHDLFISFSIWKNLKKLNSVDSNDSGLQCIHGLKTISMFLIILGHRIMFGFGSPMINLTFPESLYRKLEASVLLNGTIIVDTFFNISGFLMCYLMMMEFEKNKRRINFLFLYVHRFIRLTPAYAVVLAFYCTIFVKMGSGPLWLERVQVEQERCIASWWTNLLYLNNYINKDQMCMFQSWYMTCDMHFFLVAPVIVWLLRKNTTFGLGVLFFVIIGSVSVVFAIVYLSQGEGIMLLYMDLLKDPVLNNTFKNVYIATHMRASPYFVGMAAGYLKYHMSTKEYKMPKYMTYVGWIICIFVIESTVYSVFIFYQPGSHNALTSAAYASLHHFTWSICISWMIIAISEGNGAWIEPLLTWKPLIVLSRITYTAFLCHGAIQMYTVATLRHPSYVDIFYLVYSLSADITLAYICGLLLSLLFEMPLIGIEKIILKKGGTTQKGQVESPTKTTVKVKIFQQRD